MSRLDPPPPNLLCLHARTALTTNPHPHLIFLQETPTSLIYVFLVKQIESRAASPCIQGWSQPVILFVHISSHTPNSPATSEMAGSGREPLTASLTSPPPSALKTQLCRRSELLRNFRAAGSAQRKHLLCSGFIQVLHLGACFAGSRCSPFTSRDLRSKSVIFGCKWNVPYVGFYWHHKTATHFGMTSCFSSLESKTWYGRKLCSWWVKGTGRNMWEAQGWKSS